MLSERATTIRRCAVLLSLAVPVLAAGADAVQPAAAPPAAAASPTAEAAQAAPVTTAAPAAVAPVATPAEGPSWKQRFSGELGFGYYEVAHAGVAYHFGPRAALDVFAGVGFAFQPDTVSAGLGYRHHVGAPFWTVQAGWDVKALYWTQSDSAYDWKMMSLLGGAYVVRQLDARLSLKLDAGVALSWSLQSDRKSSQDFSTPQRWNGTVCLDLVYRFGG